MIRNASNEALEALQTLVDKLSPSPKPIKLSEHSMASGVDAALRRCDPEQEAVLRSRIIALEAEVAELHVSRSIAELSPRRSGWLFKYNSLAATLGWLGDTGAISKWERRFFVLENGEHGAELRYYGAGRTDGTPRSVIVLADVVLVDEGTCKPRRRRRGRDDGGGGATEASTEQFHVFSLWAHGTMHSSRGPASGALLRLSCASEPEALQWLSWIAAVTRERTVRRSSFVRSPTGSPTRSATDAAAPASAPAPAPAPDGGGGGLRRRPNATAASPTDGAAAPRASHGPTAAAGDATPAEAGARRADAAQPHASKQEGAASGARRGGFDPFLFPASRPMHKHAQPSLLSHGEPGGRGEANLRGFLHLMFLMLFATHLRLLLENLLQYGWLLPLPTPLASSPAAALAAALAVPAAIRLSAAALATCTLLAWAIEKMATRRWRLGAHTARATVQVPSGAIDALHALNAAVALLLPSGAVRFSCGVPVGGGVVVLLLCVTLFMKLVSYAHVHRDLRLAAREIATSREIAARSTSRDLDGAHLDGLAKPTDRQILSVCLSKPPSDPGHLAPPASRAAGVPPLPPPPLRRRDSDVVQDTDANVRRYPESVSLRGLLYFVLAPTLCYQEYFPRTSRVRPAYLASLVGRLLLLSAFNIFICQQYIMPLLSNSVSALDALDLPRLGERLLNLALPCTYVWLAGFYAFFHVWLNVLAELLRFGDRVFYLEWWNTTSFEHYWRLWNIPVHSWIARHIYFPFLRAAASRGLRRAPAKQLAGALCFFCSAVFHELIIGLPLRGVRVPLAFFAMMAQVPLISASGYLPRTEGTPFAALGNYVFWLSFCFLGQPLAVLLYFYQAQPPQC